MPQYVTLEGNLGRYGLWSGTRSPFLAPGWLARTVVAQRRLPWAVPRRGPPRPAGVPVIAPVLFPARTSAEMRPMMRAGGELVMADVANILGPYGIVDQFSIREVSNAVQGIVDKHAEAVREYMEGDPHRGYAMFGEVVRMKNDLRSQILERYRSFDLWRNLEGLIEEYKFRGR